MLLIILFSYSSCLTQEVTEEEFQQKLEGLLSHSVPEITVQEAKSQHGVIFLDARAKEEYAISHIRDARWVGYDDFEKENLGDIDKNRKVIVYCSVGYRSEKVAEELIEMGFTDVSNLYGGIFEWVNEGNAVYTNDSVLTKKVHTYNKNWSKWLRKGEKVY